MPDDVFKTQPKDNEEHVLFKVIGTFIGEGQQVDALSSYTPLKKNTAKVVVVVVVVVVGAAVVVEVVVVVVVVFEFWQSVQFAYNVEGNAAIISSGLEVTGPSNMNQQFPL